MLNKITTVLFIAVISSSTVQAAKQYFVYEKNYAKIVACAGKCGVLTIKPKKLPTNGSLYVISTISGRIPQAAEQQFYEGNVRLGQTYVNKEGLVVLYDCADYGNAVHYRLYTQIRTVKGNIIKVPLNEWIEIKVELLPCAIAHKLASYAPLNMNYFMSRR